MHGLLGLSRCAQIGSGRGDDAVHGAGERPGVVGQRAAGHAAAEPQPSRRTGISPGGGDEVRDRRADPRIEIARARDPAARDGDDAPDERLAGPHEPCDRDSGADVLAQQPDRGWPRMLRDLEPRDGREELTLRARRIDRRQHREREPRIAGGGEGGLERGAGFGFVVLDRDRAFSPRRRRGA